jgi:hypothetical protein
VRAGAPTLSRGRGQSAPSNKLGACHVQPPPKACRVHRPYARCLASGARAGLVGFGRRCRASRRAGGEPGQDVDTGRLDGRAWRRRSNRLRCGGSALEKVEHCFHNGVRERNLREFRKSVERDHLTPKARLCRDLRSKPRRRRERLCFVHGLSCRRAGEPGASLQTQR